MSLKPLPKRRFRVEDQRTWADKTRVIDAWGLTGNADSTDANDGGRKWLAATWHNEHDDVEKGMRVSFVDVTAWRNPSARRCS